MKYWRGYMVAGIFAALTVLLMMVAKSYSVLVDMVYPYATRLVQTSLAQWASGTDLLLWQILAAVLVVVAIATVVLMIVFRWNVIQWTGWVLACVSIGFCLHTGIYGLNSHAGPLSEDIRLKQTGVTITELVEATTWFRNQANALAVQVPRDEKGNPDYPSFSELAQQAGEGFQTLTYEESYSVFAGSTLPVKELGWADLFTSMGIAGVTMPLTGEAAVNPQTPVMAMPFTMCHEMAHRMCIAQERDANLAAFLACDANSDPIFRYSAYFMAFRYCYNALASDGTSTATSAAKAIRDGISPELRADLQAYDDHYNSNRNQTASSVANTVNDTYIKVSGDESGVKSYGEVADLLLSWYIQEIYLPAHQDEVEQFDPLDKNQVDLEYPTGGNGNG